MEEKDIALLKSCIISRKGGVPVEELNADYKELVGNSIPVKSFGFENLETLLSSIPGVKVKNGLVNAESEKSKHIQLLIQKQKVVPPKRKKNSKKFRPYENQRKISDVQSNRSKSGYRYQDKKANCYNNGYAIESSQHFNRIEHYLNELYELSASIDKEIMRYKQMLESRHDFTKDVDFTSDNFAMGETRNNYYFMDHQLIGDEFMMDLAVRAGRQSTVRPRTCHPDLTLGKAIGLVRQEGCAGKVLIALGAIDILSDTPLNLLINNTVDLVYEVVQQGAIPVVCTVPPLPNLRSHQAIETLNMYNSWLCSTGLPLVNLNEIFKENRSIKMNYFEGNAEQRSRYSLVYWSRKGLSAVESELERQLRY